MKIPLTPAPGANSSAAPVHRLPSILTRTWLLGLLILVVGVLVRIPALQGELIWDDSFLARDNPFIKSPVLIFEAFRHHLLLESLSMHYRPMQNVSYMLDYYFWNTNTYGYHLSNVLWHATSGVLLFLLLRRLLPQLTTLWRRPISDSGPAPEAPPSATIAAFFIALLWAVHPVHSAAVDYISGRADSLAFFFSASAWLLYLRSVQSRRVAIRTSCGVLAAFSLLLALCSRESACMWTVVFVFHLLVFEKRLAVRGKVAVLTACFLVLGAYAALRNLPEKRREGNPSNGWSAPVKGVLMLRALGDYGRLMVFPSNLHMERTVVSPDGGESKAGWRSNVSNEYLTIGGVVVLAILVVGATRRGAARSLRIFGAGWFLLAYLPISNIVDLNATVAEHWLYLPSVGMLLFLAGVVLDLPRVPMRLATAAACLMLVGFSVRSYVRSSDWLNSEVFYTHTLAAGGGSVRVVLNLGQVYAARDEFPRAEALFREALRMCPSYLMARNNLADVLARQGRKEEADQNFREASAAASEARKELPRTWVAALNVAKMRIQADDNCGALDVLAQARRDYPGVWRLISLESELLRKTSGPDAALPAVEEFARDNWWHLEAQVALGKLYFEKGDVTQAETVFRRASRLDVHDVTALNQIALLSVVQRNFGQAYATQQKAISRQPDEPRQYLILSDILEKMGRQVEAKAALAQVSRLQGVARSGPLID